MDPSGGADARRRAAASRRERQWPRAPPPPRVVRPMPSGAMRGWASKRPSLGKALRSGGVGSPWDLCVRVVRCREPEVVADPPLQRAVELLVIAALVGVRGHPPADVDVAV